MMKIMKMMKIAPHPNSTYPRLVNMVYCVSGYFRSCRDVYLFCLVSVGCRIFLIGSCVCSLGYKSSLAVLARELNNKIHRSEDYSGRHIPGGGGVL